LIPVHAVAKQQKGGRTVPRFLEPIFRATTSHDVCVAVQQALESLKTNGHLTSIPEYGVDIRATNPEVVRAWFDVIRYDARVEEEGPVRKIYDLFGTALERLRDLYFVENEYR
jgi:hypothetical protein